VLVAECLILEGTPIDTPWLAVPDRSTLAHEISDYSVEFASFVGLSLEKKKKIIKDIISSMTSA